MHPYILEILHVIVANESVPIALCVFPSETADSYDRLYQHVADVLNDQHMPNVLNGLRLVSDQGAGLKELVSRWNLDWKLCHRHLIENAGAWTRIGDWTARILRCCSEDEYQKVKTTINIEISLMSEEHRLRMESSSRLKWQHLQMMLGHVKPDAFRDPAIWARWKRLGCPTTTNAAESIHSHLNADDDSKGRTFFDATIVCQKITVWKIPGTQ
jgi:hypothetical protein